MAKNVQEVLDWLSDNVGVFYRRFMVDTRVTHYYGEGWEARWRQYGAGWFMDVTFEDEKYASFFALLWK